MSGHSQYKNIMYRKGAQDKRRAKIFARLIREITVAAKTGPPEPDKNPRLRAAVSAARTANMPKDNIERAIKRVAGGEDDHRRRNRGHRPPRETLRREKRLPAHAFSGDTVDVSGISSGVSGASRASACSSWLRACMSPEISPPDSMTMFP